MAIDTKYLIGNTDAVVWAEEWCEVAREIAESDDEREVIDEGWMIGWFANAIMAGFDEGHRRALKEAADAKPRPLGDPTEYEFFQTQPDKFDVPVTLVERVPVPEHLYADEDVARLAQTVEDLYDVLGDLLCNTIECVYVDGEEWCQVHGVGRPCPFEIARTLVRAK